MVMGMARHARREEASIVTAIARHMRQCWIDCSSIASRLLRSRASPAQTREEVLKLAELVAELLHALLAPVLARKDAVDSTRGAAFARLVGFSAVGGEAAHPASTTDVARDRSVLAAIAILLLLGTIGCNMLLLPALQFRQHLHGTAFPAGGSPLPSKRRKFVA